MKIVLDRGDFPAMMPVRGYPTDAGLDLLSPIDIIVKPRSSVVIDTGVHVEIPDGCCGFLRSKSGLMVHHDITSDGTIDWGYNGSIRVKLFNHGEIPYPIHRGDKITQLVIVRIEIPNIEIADRLEKRERGNNGFGSTGK